MNTRLKFTLRLKEGQTFDKEWLNGFITVQNKKEEYGDIITRTDYDDTSLSFTFTMFDIINIIAETSNKVRIDMVEFFNNFSGYTSGKTVGEIMEMFGCASIQMSNFYAIYTSGFYVTEFITFLDDILIAIINNKDNTGTIELNPEP